MKYLVHLFFEFCIWIVIVTIVASIIHLCGGSDFLAGSVSALVAIKAMDWFNTPLIHNTL